MLVHAGCVCYVVVEPVVCLELSLRAGVHIAVSLVLQVNVGSHNSPVEILARPEVVPGPGLLPDPTVVPLLAELLEELELLLAEAYSDSLYSPLMTAAQPSPGRPGQAATTQNWFSVLGKSKVRDEEGEREEC